MPTQRCRQISKSILEINALQMCIRDSYDTIIRLEEINLLPFQSEGIMTYVLNIIMFLPLGFLIPLRCV